MGSDNKPILTVTPASIGNPQNYFDRKKFDDFIFAHGYNAYIERTFRCPCTVEGVGQPLSNCVNCGGTGYVMIDKVQTILACQSINNRKGYTVWTAENSGTISITSRAGDKLGWMDRVTLIDLRSWFNQVVYPKVFFDGSKNVMFAFLTYSPLDVFQVYQFQSVSQSLLPLVSGVDYTISGNKIVMADSFIIETNVAISIRYTHQPAYHVIDINRDLIKQPTDQDCATGIINDENLPLHCIARKAHFMLDAPNYNGTRVVDNTNYNAPPINYDI